MRKLNSDIEKYRIRFGQFASDPSYGNNGAFKVPVGNKTALCIASDGMGWEHVSVSLPSRCPTWEEMCFVKDLFWEAEETVVQYHPSRSEYVNNCANCLHLWRPLGVEMPHPPRIMVGI